MNDRFTVDHLTIGEHLRALRDHAERHALFVSDEYLVRGHEVHDTEFIGECLRARREGPYITPSK